jgi:hypothetical protein
VHLVGVVAVSWVAEMTLTLVAARLPMVTLEPASKPVPVRVTAVPPLVKPLVETRALKTHIVSGRPCVTFLLP